MAHEPDDLPAEADGDEEDRLWDEAIDAAENDGAEDEDEGDGPDSADAGEQPPEAPAADDELSATRAENEKLKSDRRADLGRINSLRKQVEAVTKAAEGDDPTAALEAMVEDYPEIASPILAALKRTNGQVSAMAEAKRSELADAEANVAAGHAENATELHRLSPGGLAYVKQNDAAFTKWIMDQPLADRNAATRNGSQIEDPTETADLIRRFKEANGGAPPVPPADNRRQRQISATAGPRRGGRPLASGIPRDGDPDVLMMQILDNE
jgi:hypothetical protein